MRGPSLQNAALNQRKQKYERYHSNCRGHRADVRLRLYHQPGEPLRSQRGYGEHRAPPDYARNRCGGWSQYCISRGWQLRESEAGAARLPRFLTPVSQFGNGFGRPIPCDRSAGLSLVIASLCVSSMNFMTTPANGIVLTGMRIGSLPPMASCSAGLQASTICRLPRRSGPRTPPDFGCSSSWRLASCEPGSRSFWACENPVSRGKGLKIFWPFCVEFSLLFVLSRTETNGNNH